MISRYVFFFFGANWVQSFNTNYIYCYIVFRNFENFKKNISPEIFFQKENKESDGIFGNIPKMRGNGTSKSYILIHYVRSSVRLSDEGFGGWGRERPVKQRVTGVNL